MTQTYGPAQSLIPAVLASVLGVYFAVVAVVGIFVIVVVANRAESDPTGRRPLAVYYFAVSFFTLFAALFGSFGIVLGLVQLIGSHPGSGGGGAIHPVGDAVARTAVLSGIITVVALGVLVVHLRRGLAVSGRADPRLGPVGRVAQSYVAATAFTALLTMVVAIVVALYEVARIVAPGVFEVPGTRVETLRPTLAAAYLALAALVILVMHIRLVPAEIRRVSWSTVRPMQGPEDDPGLGGPGPGGPRPGGPGLGLPGLGGAALADSQPAPPPPDPTLR